MWKLKQQLQFLNTLDIIDKILDSDDEYDSNMLDTTVIYLNSKFRIPKEDEPPSYEPPTKKKSIDLNNPLRGLKDAENPIEMHSEAEFKKLYKFSKETVTDILQMIMYGLKKVTNRGQPIPPLMELLITLKFMITGSFQTKIEDKVSQPSVCRIIRKITTLLADLKLRFVKLPDRNDLRRVNDGFKSLGGFPEVVGCLGSTHIGVKSPGKAMADGYLNEKGYYSFRVQVHRLMLTDKPRLEAYKTAIIENKALFKDATVLDIGAGTGILSVFCAQAGAKKVIAVEASALANIAREVVRENKYENIIQVVHNKVENLVLPENEKVDIIVSEWMGFYLLHEGMLDSVVAARDKFLKPDSGKMFPESATVFAAPCSLPNLFGFWSDVHGVSMNCFGSKHREQISQRPEITVVQQEDLLANPEVLCWLDLKDVTIEELNEYKMNAVAAASREGLYQGLCVWFTCRFPTFDDTTAAVELSTAPDQPPTHWKQTVIVLPEEQQKEKGEPIAWELLMKRSQENNRRYTLELTMEDPEKVTHSHPCDCYMTKCIVIKKFLQQNPSGEEHF